MRGSKLQLQAAFRPSLQASEQASTSYARGLVLRHQLCYQTNYDFLQSCAVPSPSLRSRKRLYQVKKGGVVHHLASRPTPNHGAHPLLLSGTHHDPGATEPPSNNRGSISDHEYQTRVGKACRVLVDSLPDFMHKGVVDLGDLESDHDPSHSASKDTSNAGRSKWSAKGLLPSLSPFLGQSLLRRAPWSQDGKTKSDEDSRHDSVAFDSLYHPSIAFEFRPPLPHIGIGKSEGPGGTGASSVPSSSENSLAVFEQRSRGGPTICFNGRTMYVASSHLLRHALSALFHDTSLHLESARFEGRSKAGSSWPGISPYIRRSTQSGADPDSSTSGSWQDKLVVRLRFEGISRVTSHPHTYTVIFKYDFDRETGMIARHVVDNIQPVPGSKVWAGLTNVWGTLSPAGGGAAPGGGSAACTPKEAGRGP